MNSNLNDKTNVKLVASKDSWIEGEAIRQLNKTAELEGVEYSVGLPDLHPGRGNPVGAAFLIKDMIYPYLIGNDVGCGISLYATDIRKNKIKIDKWIKRLDDLNQPYEIDQKPWLDQFDLTPSLSDMALGTIGGGNHFVELQMVEKIFDEETFAGLGLDKNYLNILVHSGSRGLGEALLRKHTDKYGAKGLDMESQEAKEYLTEHDHALKWARCNRALIAHRFASEIAAECLPVLDACHNSITEINFNSSAYRLHRKGAAPSNSGSMVIPGSRGSLSYFVKPKGEQDQNLWSLPHGAGRKWNRGSCKERLKDRFKTKALLQTEIGSHVICDDKELLYEEAPQAYKNINQVIKDLLDAGLIEIIATLKPVITYKNRKQ